MAERHTLRAVPSQAPRLITIPISHYCEKARWALERAEIPYREEPHLQAIHWAHVWRAGRGRTAPVLVTEDGAADRVLGHPALGRRAQRPAPLPGRRGWRAGEAFR